MTPADFLDDDTKERFRKYAAAMEEAEPVVRYMRDEGMPVQQHVNGFSDQLEWIAKIRKVFQIME